MALDLIILTPDHKTNRHPLDGETVTLGRAHSNDLSYPEDASLSRRHLQFFCDEKGWWVEDLKSKNGTLLNDTRITTKHALRPGDRLSAGHLTLRVVDSGAGEDDDVIFVPEAGPEIHPDATVMTSLDGLISGDATAPIARPTPNKALDRRGAFDTPEVQALFRAGRLLADKMPLEELFPQILDLSINAVGAERGVLMTLENERLVPSAVHGEGFRISTTVRDRVLKEKTSLLVRNLQQDEAFKQQVSIFEQQIHTMMAAPLQTEDRVIGLIYVDSRSFVREFTPDDLNLLTVLANVAAIRIEQQRLAEVEEQNRRRQADLDNAARIQRRLLPTDVPIVPGLDLAGHNAACQTVGGDYYDFICYPDGRVAVVLGDVAGKGMEAALMMTNLQARVQILSEDPTDLARLMERLDLGISIKCPHNRFITLFFGLIDPNSGRLTSCNAGHNPAILIRASGETETIPPSGVPLGMMPGLGYKEETLDFRPGDLLAVFSDGITEVEGENEEEYGEQRLARTLVGLRDKPAAEIVQHVLDEVDDWNAFDEAPDDMTLVVARRVE